VQAADQRMVRGKMFGSAYVPVFSSTNLYPASPTIANSTSVNSIQTSQLSVCRTIGLRGLLHKMSNMSATLMIGLPKMAEKERLKSLKYDFDAKMLYQRINHDN
jgi:hypothetical protein